MGKFGNFFLDAIIAVGDAKAKQMPKHRQVDVFQEEVTWTLRDGYKRKTNSIHMIETDIPRYGRDYNDSERSTKKSPRSSFLVRAACAPFKLTWSGMRKLSGLFGSAADDRNYPANDWNIAQDNRPLITRSQQTGEPDVKQQERERSIAVLFPSDGDKEINAGTKSEDSSRTPPGSPADRNGDDLRLMAGCAKAGRANVRRNAGEASIRPQSLTFRENVRLDREP